MTSITIDGPSGAGKSTISKLLAEKINYEYLDTGAMYRAITYYLLENNIDLDNEDEICQNLSNIEISFDNSELFLNGNKLSKEIRTREVTNNASKVSSYKCVRDKMTSLQRLIAKGKNIVLDGRDTGSTVLPNAEFKFFLTASPEARAKRRFDQLLEDGMEAGFDQVLMEIKERDYKDENREISPLRVPENAYIIDSSDLNIEETISRFMEIINVNL